MSNRFVWKTGGQLVIVLLGLLGLPVLLSATEQFPGESAKWRRYQSPHFEMFSAARDGETRELLHKLELLRGLFYETMKLKEREPKDVTIYYFNHEKAFKNYVQLKQRKDIAGFYLSRPDRGVIVLSPAWDDDEARAIIFHEYIHHLNRAIGTEPPLWYNEGVAELFSTVEFEKSSALLGNPLGWHIHSLRSEKLLPLDALFTVNHQSPIYNTGQHSGQFYAQSWALMHYWQFGKHQLDRKKVELFLLYATSVSHQPDRAFLRKLFQETMGMDYPEMQKALQEYVTSGSFFNRKAALPKVAEPTTYESRALPLEEIRERLAELGLRVNEDPTAKLALMNAVERSPSAARIWEVLGNDAWMQADMDLAKERWEKALAAGSRNPAIFHELGQIAGRRWFSRFNYYLRLPAETAEQLRLLFNHSIAAAPEQFAGYEMLAWVEAYADKPNITNVNLVQGRFNTLQNKARTLVAFALVRVRMGDPEGAKKVLASLSKVRADRWCKVAAEEILAHIENREPRKLPDEEEDENKETIQLRFQVPELPGK